MNRKYARITIDELKAKAIEACKARNEEDNLYPLHEILEDDLKVRFDTENFDCENPHPEYVGTDAKLIGFHTLKHPTQSPEKDLTLLGCRAGGDWEVPVFFIVYWDGKKLRAYIPTDGNPYNLKEKRAFGNHDSDAEEANKLAVKWGIKVEEEIDKNNFDPVDVMDHDWVAIENDIRDRFMGDKNVSEIEDEARDRSAKLSHALKEVQGALNQYLSAWIVERWHDWSNEVTALLEEDE